MAFKTTSPERGSSEEDINGEVSDLENVVSFHIENRPKNFSFSFDDFDIGPHIGSGTFGSVYLVREKFTCMHFSLKVILKEYADKSNLNEEIQREVKIHSRLNHPNVVRFYTQISDSTRIGLVLQYCSEGDLFRYIKKHKYGQLSNQKAAKFTYQMAKALSYLHKQNIVHRDFKPENVFLDVYLDAKLGDFSWATEVTNRLLQKRCGTEEYFAPEMIRKRRYGCLVDVWGLGVLCYEMLVGKTPFFDELANVTLKNIITRKLEFPRHIGPLARHLISSLLQLEPDNRLKLSHVFTHPWIEKHTERLMIDDSKQIHDDESP